MTDFRIEQLTLFREEVIGYPMDFWPMSDDMIDRLSSRGELHMSTNREVLSRGIGITSTTSDVTIYFLDVGSGKMMLAQLSDCPPSRLPIAPSKPPVCAPEA